MALVSIALLSSCAQVQQVGALPGQAKLRREGPEKFSLAYTGANVDVVEVDGRTPKVDPVDRSVILTPGSHEVELSVYLPGLEANPGVIRAFVESEAAKTGTPQRSHRFVAKSGHDYIMRHSIFVEHGVGALWIEDYSAGGLVVSGSRPKGAKPLRDPFVQKK